MSHDADKGGTDVGSDALDNGDAGRQVAHLTGMSADAAATFAAYHSGRFAPHPSFREAA